ncbi:DUF2617 family protein [Tundrisphaera lichenicola]|uniref:DUF2617 family protein n=1 Tax=Tundrisphaera lichenicola TaxID=2029860 RepID=UPI003EBA7985
MGSSLSQSRVADLAFQVFGRTLHPDWFAVKAHRRVAVDGWLADIRIVEGGHAVTWRSGEVRLTEVLTGPSAALPEAGLLFHSPVRHERAAMIRPASGFEYQACLEVERIDPEVFDHLCDEMTRDAARDRLYHRWSDANRMAPPAISHVAFESRARGLLVHAFHSFPAERAIVRTQSLFEVPVARPMPG